MTTTNQYFNNGLPQRQLPGNLQLPSSFNLNKIRTFYSGFRIWRDSKNIIKTNLNSKDGSGCTAFNTTANVYYVSPSGDNSTGATWATAKTTINGAITAANTAAKPAVIYIAPGVYIKTAGFGGVAPAYDMAFICSYGRVNTGAFNVNTWSLTSGSKYQAANTAAVRVFDVLNITSNGLYAELTKAASLVAMTAGTWFTDGTTVYVWRADGAAVSNTNTRVIENSSDVVKATTSVNIYLENIDIEGGNSGCVFITGGSSYTNKLGAYKCSFRYAANSAGSQNCVNIQGIGAAVFEDCEFAGAQGKGLSATIFSGNSSIIITINCVGHDNGGGATGIVTSCNGLYGQSGCVGIDISGIYYNNYGANVNWAGVTNTNTQFIGFGTMCYNSYGDSTLGGTTPSIDFQCGLTADAGTYVSSMWLDNCLGYNSVNSAYTSNSAASLYHRNSQLTTLNNTAGTLAAY